MFVAPGGRPLALIVLEPFGIAATTAWEART